MLACKYGYRVAKARYRRPPYEVSDWREHSTLRSLECHSGRSLARRTEWAEFGWGKFDNIASIQYGLRAKLCPAPVLFFLVVIHVPRLVVSLTTTWSILVLNEVKS